MKKDYLESVKEIGKGGGVGFLTGVIGQVTRILFHLMMGRVLGAKGFGLYSLGHSIFQIGHVVSMVGLQNAVVHFLAIFRGEGDEVRARGTIYYALRIVVATSSCVAISLWLLAPWLANNMFAEASLGWVLRAFAAALPFYAVFMLFAYCARGLRNILYYSGSIDVVHPIANVILVGGALAIGLGLEGALIGFVLSTAVSMFLLVIVMVGFFGRVFSSKKGSRVEVNRILAFAITVLPIDLSKPLLNDQTDHILLGYFGVVRDVGIYSVGFLVGAKVAFFQHMFNGIFAPVVADLYNRGKRDDLEQLFKTVAKWTISLTLPLFFACVFAGSEILSFFGSEFREGELVLLIIALSNLINIGFGPAGLMLLMAGRPALELFNNGVGGVGNIFLNAWLIPRYGAVGAAVGTGLSMVFVNALRLVEVYCIHRCHPFRLGTLRTLIVFGLSWGVVWYVGHWFSLEGSWLLTAVPLFIIVYGGMFAALGCDEEDKLIWNYMSDKICRYRLW